MSFSISCCIVRLISNVYSGHCKTSKMEHFSKAANGLKPLTVENCSILEIWQGSEHACGSSVFKPDKSDAIKRWVGWW